ncbi:dihydroorotase [Phragmitibacter flavus]|nr:dihydroorotase [Phragmitibacter flavus]
MTLTLPKWFDLHTHFRQGPAMADYLKAHLNMGCAGALAMPNTQPPVSRVSGSAQPDSWSIESYSADLKAAGAGNFEHLIVPLYLTRQTTAQMIRDGATSGILRACKYYPPHGTTNAEHGMPMDDLIGGEVLRAMEDHGIILCIHGEQHALSGPDYLDATQNAETRFYRERMPRLIEAHPRLRIVCEHITTRTAAEFVASTPDHIGATITPQHLLYTLGHLIQGLKYHLFCLPVVKFQDDRAALREQATQPGQSKFFAGTDSAPHTTKATPCGCAAGCFTGGIAPQLYAMAFEEAGLDLSTTEGQSAFTNFLCLNGPAFYQFPASTQTFQMHKAPSQASLLDTPNGPVTPLSVGLGIELTWQIA